MNQLLSVIDQLRPEARAESGQQILELYFAQLFHSDTTVLDLRPERFAWLDRGAAGPRLQWAPRPYSPR